MWKIWVLLYFIMTFVCPLGGIFNEDSERKKMSLVCFHRFAVQSSERLKTNWSGSVCEFIFLTSFHRSVNTSISVRVKIILSLLSSHSATVDFWILEDWGVILSGDNLIIRGNNPYYSRELNESAALNQRLKAKKALTSFNKVRLYLRWPPRPRGLWLDGSRTVIF